MSIQYGPGYDPTTQANNGPSIPEVSTWSDLQTLEGETGAVVGSTALVTTSPVAGVSGKMLVLRQATKWELSGVNAQVLAYVQAHPIPQPLIPMTNVVLMSYCMNLRDYAPDTLNGDGGGAVFRGVLTTGLADRTYSKIYVLIGASSTNEPDSYRVAIGQGADNNTSATYTEVQYPNGLSYAKPATPTTAQDLTGVWLEQALTPVGMGSYVNYSIEAAGTGWWATSPNAGTNSYNDFPLAFANRMDASGTLTGSFSSSFAVHMGIVAWAYEVSGNPLYNIATFGDSTWSGTRPLDAENSLCVEGCFYYANTSELANGMRWNISNWGNGAYDMGQYLQRARSVLPLLQGKAQILIVQAWTYNSSPASLADALNQQNGLLQFKADAEALGFVVIFGITNPQGSPRISEGMNEGRDAMDAWVLEQGGFNASSAVWDPNDHRQFLAGYAEDNVHINAAGSRAQGPVIAQAITSILQTRGLL